MKAVGAAHLEGTVFTSMRTLMAIEEPQNRKWEHQADIWPNEGTTLEAHGGTREQQPF